MVLGGMGRGELLVVSLRRLIDTTRRGEDPESKG